MFLDGFMVDFNKEDRVEFIELAKSEQFRGVFEGRCLHDLPADEAVAFVSQFGTYDPNNRELRYSYIFLDLQLSLWRGTIVEPGQPDDDPDGRYFEAVGIAVDGYFADIKPTDIAVHQGLHSQLDEQAPPCPCCGKPLRTAKAQQCFECGANWHGRVPKGD
jgi:hypothetical protein